jgi:hypothetical protein
MHRLLVMTGRAAFPCENLCQGQLQTPHSVSVHIELGLKMRGAASVLPQYTFMAWTATPYLYHTTYVSYDEWFKVTIIFDICFLEKKR